MRADFARRLRWLAACTCLLVAPGVAAQVTYYLAGNGTGSDVPVGALTTTAPTRTSLPNYDPVRNNDPGLTLNESSKGFAESDPKRYQWWLVAAGGTSVTGNISLTIWTAIKDYSNDKPGALSAYLADCDAAATSCTLITSANRTAKPWGVKGSWIQDTLSFNAANYTIPTGRYLGLKIVRPNNAKDDLWVAYDTTAFPSRLTITPAVAVIGGFNAFETSTAANALTGPIKTKVAGQSFTLAIIALNSARTAYSTSAISPIQVELLDASDSSGVLDSATGCRSSWTSLATITSTLSFASGDNGRKNLAMQLNRAAANVVVRITNIGGSNAVGCSTDNFAVRPASFVSLQATDTNDSTTGTARTLNNNNATSGVVHRAGRDFTVLAAAVNADGVTLSTGYNGNPLLAISSCLLPAGCTAGNLDATLETVDGAVSGTGNYSEGGAFSATLTDTNFADVDSADSTLAERTISTVSEVTMGRFVPDAYLLSVSTAPQFVSPLCAAGPSRQTFNFVGQPFSFGTAPVVLATPLNASGATLANARPRYLAANVSNGVTAAGAPVALTGTTSVSNIAHAATSLITFGAGSFTFTRGTTPVASFAPTLTMTVNLADTTENGTAGNSTINAAAALTFTPIGFAAAAGTFHYGRAQLRPTYGDVRRELYAPLELQRYNAVGWIALPDMGACLVAPATTFAYSNTTGLLNAGGGATNCASRVASTVTTGSGRAAIRLDKPGGVTTTDASAMTMTLNLLAAPSGTSCSGATPTPATTVNAPWLANPDGTNPSARLTWGRSRGELFGLRERFD